MNAKENAQQAFLARQEKLFSGSFLAGRSDGSKIQQLTKCLIQGIDCSTIINSDTQSNTETHKTPGTVPGSPVLSSAKKYLKSQLSKRETEPLRLVRGRSSESKIQRSHNTPVTTKATSISNSFEYQAFRSGFGSSSNNNPNNTSYENYLPISRLPSKREEITLIKKQAVNRKPVLQSSAQKNGYAQIH